MDNKILTINKLDKILNNCSELEKIVNLKNIPAEELKIFLSSFNLLDKIWAKIDFRILGSLNKDELKKWSIIYVIIHDLFHEEINNKQNYNLSQLEIYSTIPIFIQLKETINSENYQKFIYAYFSLGLGALKINHRLENLISEKIILGEFSSIGGLENDLWGVKLKTELFDYALKTILNKFENSRYEMLIKRYKNFVFKLF